MIRLKKSVPLFALLFLVSLVSSSTAWYMATHKEKKEISWKETLHLNPEQEKKFSDLESALNDTLKEMNREEAQNKISLCAHLHNGKMDEEKIKSSSKKMAEIYEQKQEKTAAILASISSLLTPEQRKTFSQRLMQEVCVSCQKSTEQEKCLCGMCGM